MDKGRTAGIVLLTAAFAGMLAAFNLATARIIASGRTAKMIHRDSIVHGDGARLYAYLRSAWFDGDLNTANELNHYFNYPGSREPVPIITTSTSYAWNHTPVGCAILWSPFFLIGHLSAVRMHDAGHAVAVDGYSPPYTLAIALGTHLYCFLGVLLLFLICRRFYSPAASLLAVLTVWLASFLPAYLFLYPSMSHALSFFSVSLFLWLWLRVRDDGRPSRWLLLGCAGGLMALVRTQNCIFFIVPLIGYPRTTERSAPKELIGIFLMFAGAALAFVPQAYAWKVTYGKWLTIPQGEGFLHWGRPAVAQVLFSPRHGLFSWTPALMLGAAGLPLFLRREKLLGASLIAALLIQLYLNSIVDDWWAGTGFGARRFDNCLPALGLGAAALYEWLRAKRLAWLAVALTGIFILWNGLFLCQYALNWVSHMEAMNMAEMVKNQIRMIVHIIHKVQVRQP
jgi:hypothetical protein